MRRRNFIKAIAGSTVAWPLPVHAQERERVRRLAILLSLAANDPEGQGQNEAFVQGLAQLGWQPGLNLHIEPRWAGGDAERLRSYAAEIAALRPDVIVLNGTPALTAMRQQTQTTPIVFVNVADPVGSGFVDSLARPGGHTTGFINYESTIIGKWLGFLKEIMPGMTRSLAIYNSVNSAHQGQLRAIEGVASLAGVRMSQLDITMVSDIEAALDDFARGENGGLIVLPDFQITANRDRIIASAVRNKLPGAYPFQSFATSGGLLAYAVDSFDLYRHGAASYVDRILRGAKPADLPVQAPTKFNLVINLRSAKALGITVPPTLLARADEVIE